MTLTDCQSYTILERAVPAIIALLSALAGTWLGARLTFRTQSRLSVIQSRQQTYAAIMGIKLLLTQLYVSRFEALAFSDYHERLWLPSGAPSESIDLDEAKRRMRKSEDFAIEIAKANQSLFESIGQPLCKTIVSIYHI